jgi:hypothetical protein
MTSITSIPHFIGINDIGDLINGLAITITSSDKTFDYTEAYLLLNEINRVLYQSIDIEPYSLKTHQKPPLTKDIEATLIMGNLICAYSLAPNQNQMNHHIHGFVYGLLNHSKPINEWISYVETELKKLKPISRKNRYSIVMKPINDLVDKSIRNDNYSYKSLLQYITEPDYGTFLHYIKYRNSNQLFYHYS